jgi:tetratricopeptide (TPR) repeat protein
MHEMAQLKGVESPSPPPPAGSLAYCLIYAKGRQVTPTFARVRPAQNGHVAVQVDGRWGIVDLADPYDEQLEKMPVPLQFAAVTSVNSAGYAFVQRAPRQWLRINVRAQRPFRNGLAAAQAGNHQEAVNWFQQAADLNDAAAMGNLGYMYLQGMGVPRNIPLAAEWLLKGAEGGDAHSMMNLASLLLQNNRREEAVSWLQRAAALGHPQAGAALEQIGRMPATAPR